ncbi:hypothetical protein [Hahella ganghwensis]|uniref:hypothetical protein n=1 Tax=Hahella ganghwensis TaxID=286420 RepID=UPI001FDFD24D|nr:hypothetical protein [Hahella ganghwensis]
MIKTMFVGLVVTGLSACGAVQHMMYKTTGDVMVNFASDHQVPFTLGTEDMGINCAMSEALTPMLMSFGRVRDEPHKLAVITYGSAGLCAEAMSWEEELRYMRAIKGQNANEAEDALIAQKRLNVVAAKRNYIAYQHLVAAYGEPGGECPDLDEELDEFIWMMGMVSGLQALNNEITSTSGLGVPKNIAAKVERAATCVDDDRWWGVPMALRATIWAMLPGAEPQGEDAMKRLKMAAKKGERAGVRLAHVFQALAYFGKGDTENVKQVIRDHVKAKKKKDANPDYKLLDELSTTLLMAMSDRMWTDAKGYRTPIGGLGTFWDDQKASAADTIDLDDIL